MVTALGGPAHLLDHYDSLLPQAPVVRPLISTTAGYISHIDTRALGLCVVQLGGGRTRADDSIDPAVGLENVISIGQSTERALATIHARDETAWQAAASALQNCITIGHSLPAQPKMIHEIFH